MEHIILFSNYPNTYAFDEKRKALYETYGDINGYDDESDVPDHFIKSEIDYENQTETGTTVPATEESSTDESTTVAPTTETTTRAPASTTTTPTVTPTPDPEPEPVPEPTPEPEPTPDPEPVQ